MPYATTLPGAHLFDLFSESCVSAVQMVKRVRTEGITLALYCSFQKVSTEAWRILRHGTMQLQGSFLLAEKELKTVSPTVS